MLSREDIRESTKAGENIRGELIIAAENGSRIKGIAYSSHRRFLLGKERFTGEKIEIPYGADVKGLNPGDSFEGELVLSTSIGEYRVPFAIQVEPCRIKTSAGSIRDLDAFAELAKKDVKEAYHLFLDDSFPELLKEEQEVLPYYYAMAKNPVTWQHLEEFLIGTGKKDPVKLHLEQENLKLLLLNTKNILLKDTTVSIGTVNASCATPREIFIEALRSRACGIILLHNHPSGDPTPSREYCLFTERVMEAGKLMGVPLLDHIIIGDNSYVSLRERGIFET